MLPASRDALEGRGLIFRLRASNPPTAPRWSLAMGLVLTCVPAGLGGLSCDCLSNTVFSPLVIDCPAGCVCLHCPGVQLDRATLWQVPQPGTSALDVQRTVHIRQVCVCLLRPRREESSSKPRCLLCRGPGEAGSRITQWNGFYQLWLKPLCTLIVYTKNSSEHRLKE